ncbi:MAG: hypothetical protein GWN79_03415, partial [Actinobacteria bacterium]|nr:hypothetical protein [Actinomycetota bacterium]NIS29521.1 hypothetical protein [Actinomycetota bacterium]NIT94579.1 hypothetical protein [Actinomycetota bacterium]NIU18189.1 hypothetical protein [Actinomycetota bacterium]NIU64864.1 hypothetical protein [Actinomycetota bacterium]
YAGADIAFEPGIGDIVDRVTEPGFDPDNDPDDDAFVDSIEFDPTAATVLFWMMGGV